MTAARSRTPPAPTIIAPVRCTATSQPCRWSPAMIGATAYSPTPPGSWWWPGTSRMPSAGERSASASTSAGVTTVRSARTPASRRDGVSSARASSAAASSSHSQSLISATSSRGPALVTTSRSGPRPSTAAPSSITASRWVTSARPPPVSATSMNWSSMREESASAWPCLVTTAPRTSDTTSSRRTRGGQGQHRQPAAVGLGEHLGRAPAAGRRCAGRPGPRCPSSPAARPGPGSWPGRPAGAGHRARRGRRRPRRRAGPRGCR